jgi:hypothetical protein
MYQLKTNIMAKVTKERIANVCKRVNEGMRPSYAAKAEGLGGGYLIALRESGIIYKDNEGNWKGMVKIHSSRFETFIVYRQNYDKAIISDRYTSKHPIESVKQEVKVGLFRKIWRSMFG